MTSPAQTITTRLGGRWCGTYGIARCPAHDDGRPSLSVRDGDTRVLFHCFAGCESARIAEIVNRGDEWPEPDWESRKSAKSAPDRATLARSIWDGLQAHLWGPSLAYLQRRGIAGASAALRHDPAAIYTDEGGQRRTAPALTILFSDEDGDRAIQRVFLTADGHKLPIADNKRFLGLRAGATARLTPPARIIGIAEGVEDAMSVTALYDVPCWAAGGIENYRNLTFPPEVQRIVLFTQHGPEAERAIGRGRANLTEKQRTLDIAFPEAEMDWNDMLVAVLRP